MKILIVPNAFKECLLATEVAKNIEKGIKKVDSNISTLCMPLSDGGDGLIEAVTNNIETEFLQIKVHNPIGNIINSSIAMLNDGTAIIEIAQAIGLHLLTENEKNPLKTSSYGVGEQIKQALNLSCKQIIVGIGGSATNDCGAGMLSALGVKFFNSNNELITNINGEKLADINYIDTNEIDQRIYKTKIVVACDVQNVLTGKNGASQVYAMQKGATQKQALLLDKNLIHFAEIIKKEFNKDVENLEGSGAAGGLGASLLAFCNAELHSGFNIVTDILNLEDKIKISDIIITGEGNIDEQTMFGKAPYGLAQLAQKYKKPLIGIFGQINNEQLSLYNSGFTALFSIINKPMNLQKSIINAPLLIQNISENIVRLIQQIK